MNTRAKKILRNVIFLLSIPLIISAFVFANMISQKQVCNGLQISILNPELSFVTKSDVIDMIEKEGIKPNMTLVHQIDVKSIEKAIEANKWISNADVFVAANSFLNVRITQKNPILRVQQKDAGDYAYYLDQYANPIEISEQFTPRLLVATTNRLEYSKKDLNLKSSLVHIADFIQKDTFWNTFISQIDMNSNGEISLVPMLGKQTILIGNDEQLENKFARLFEFYKQGMNTIDWNLYDELDLRFMGQVVARNFSGEILYKDPYGDKEQKLMKTESVEKKLTAKKNESVTHAVHNSNKKTMPKNEKGTLKPNVSNKTTIAIKKSAKKNNVLQSNSKNVKMSSSKLLNNKMTTKESSTKGKPKSKSSKEVKDLNK